MACTKSSSDIRSFFAETSARPVLPKSKQKRTRTNGKQNGLFSSRKSGRIQESSSSEDSDAGQITLASDDSDDDNIPLKRLKVSLNTPPFTKSPSDVSKLRQSTLSFKSDTDQSQVKNGVDTVTLSSDEESIDMKDTDSPAVSIKKVASSQKWLDLPYENPEIFDESPTQTTGRKAKAAANLRISQFVLMESERKSDGRDIRGFFRKIPVVMKMETCPKLPNMRALKRAMQSEDVSLTPDDAAQFLLNLHQSDADFDLAERLFMLDSEAISALIHENFHGWTEDSENLCDQLKQISTAADLISIGDLGRKIINVEDIWTLEPIQGLFSAVLPGVSLGSKNSASKVWKTTSDFGQSSKILKCCERMDLLTNHGRMRFAINCREFVVNFSPFLINFLTGILANENQNDPKSVAEMFASFDWSADDLKTFLEFNEWPGEKSPWTNLPPKIRQQFTELFTKRAKVWDLNGLEHLTIAD